MTKDVNGFARLAEELGFDAPVCVQATEYFRRALAAGLGDADHTAIDTLIDKEKYA
jgi:3-hydroxyisobutyrate dehydrogenase-like beta-hydroxyacid dehydrogenase